MRLAPTDLHRAAFLSAAVPVPLMDARLRLYVLSGLCMNGRVQVSQLQKDVQAGCWAGKRHCLASLAHAGCCTATSPSHFRLGVPADASCAHSVDSRSCCERSLGHQSSAAQSLTGDAKLGIHGHAAEGVSGSSLSHSLADHLDLPLGICCCHLIQFLSAHFHWLKETPRTGEHKRSSEMDASALLASARNGSPAGAGAALSSMVHRTGCVAQRPRSACRRALGNSWDRCISTHRKSGSSERLFGLAGHSHGWACSLACR